MRPVKRICFHFLIGKVKIWTPEMVTENLTEIFETYGISLNSANDSVLKIQVSKYS